MSQLSSRATDSICHRKFPMFLNQLVSCSKSQHNYKAYNSYLIYIFGAEKNIRDAFSTNRMSLFVRDYGIKNNY